MSPQFPSPYTELKVQKLNWWDATMCDHILITITTITITITNSMMFCICQPSASWAVLRSWAFSRRTSRSRAAEPCSETASHRSTPCSHNMRPLVVLAMIVIVVMIIVILIRGREVTLSPRDETSSDSSSWEREARTRRWSAKQSDHHNDDNYDHGHDDNYDQQSNMITTVFLT